MGVAVEVALDTWGSKTARCFCRLFFFFSSGLKYQSWWWTSLIPLQPCEGCIMVGAFFWAFLSSNELHNLNIQVFSALDVFFDFLSSVLSVHPGQILNHLATSIIRQCTCELFLHHRFVDGVCKLMLNKTHLSFNVLWLSLSFLRSNFGILPLTLGLPLSYLASSLASSVSSLLS